MRFVKVVPAGPASKNGLLGEYFAGWDFEKRVLTRTDPKIEFRWCQGSPGESVPAENFSVRWTGQLAAPADGEYTFSAECDDFGRMWIDGRKVFDGVVKAEGRVRLAAAKRHDLKIEFAETSGTATMVLRWSGPGIDGTRVLAGEHLFPPKPDK